MNNVFSAFISLFAIIGIQQAFILFLLLRPRKVATQHVEQHEKPFACSIEQDTGKHISYY